MLDLQDKLAYLSFSALGQARYDELEGLLFRAVWPLAKRFCARLLAPAAGSADSSTRVCRCRLVHGRVSGAERMRSRQHAN